MKGAEAPRQTAPLAEASAARGRSHGYAARIAVGALIYLVFKFVVPAYPPITKAGMEALGIFILMLFLWLTEGVGWTSYLIIGLFGISGILTGDQIIALSWGNWMTPFMASCLLINHAMKTTGLSRRLALGFIARPFVAGRPWRFITMFLLACLVIGCFMSSSPVTVLFISIAEQIFESTGYTREEKLPKMLVAAIAWIATATMAMTPISHVLVIMIMGYIRQDFGVSVGFLEYSAFGVDTGALFFLCVLLICRFVVRPDVSKLRELDIDALRGAVPPVSREEKLVGAVFGLLVLAWIFPELLRLSPLAGSPFAETVGGFGTAIPAVLAVGVLCMLRVKGRPVLDFEAGTAAISWTSVVMIACLMVNGSVLSSDEAGISQFLSDKLEPMVRHLPATLFVALIMLVIVVLTNFMSNTVCALLYTIIAPMAASIPGLNPIAVGMMVAGIANYGLATPPATTTTSVAVGSGWVDGAFLFRYGWLGGVAIWLIYVLVGYPIANAVF